MKTTLRLNDAIDDLDDVEFFDLLSSPLTDLEQRVRGLSRLKLPSYGKDRHLRKHLPSFSPLQRAVMYDYEFAVQQLCFPPYYLGFRIPRPLIDDCHLDSAGERARGRHALTARRSRASVPVLHRCRSLDVLRTLIQSGANYDIRNKVCDACYE